MQLVWQGIFILFIFGFVQSESVQVSISSQQVIDNDSIQIHWELSTQSIKNEKILIWNTPLENEWNSNLFNIKHINSGEHAIYIGKAVNRVPPKLENFVSCEHSLEGVLELTEGYSFTKFGTYSISMIFGIQFLSGEFLLAKSNTIFVTIDEPILNELPVLHERDVGYIGCFQNQTEDANLSIIDATSASLNALNYLDQVGRTDKTSYVNWFGNYSISNWNTVQSNFYTIHKNLDNRNLNINCECDNESAYAYVYPSDKSHTIYLCPPFWEHASLNPYHWNSQPGTITHEMSHFADISDTLDITYGPLRCYNLAEDDPSEAIINADSYQCFQESRPTVSYK